MSIKIPRFLEVRNEDSCCENCPFGFWTNDPRFQSCRKNADVTSRDITHSNESVCGDHPEFFSLQEIK